MSMEEESARYQTYLERFDAEVGPRAVGQFARRNGILVRKLAFEEFRIRWRELQELERDYRELLRRGDTISDVVVRLLRERVAELFVDLPGLL